MLPDEQQDSYTRPVYDSRECTGTIQQDIVQDVQEIVLHVQDIPL
jgi:hypothetical protein